eukprot:2276383-Pyramimonas_sp.AAC.1
MTARPNSGSSWRPLRSSRVGANISRISRRATRGPKAARTCAMGAARRGAAPPTQPGQSQRLMI